jgi:hypothetical protein
MKPIEQRSSSVLSATRRARRRVYVELEEHVARALERGAANAGQTPSIFLSRVLSRVVRIDGPEFESTRPLCYHEAR